MAQRSSGAPAGGAMGGLELKGILLDVSYVTRNDRGIIRLSLKTREKTYNLLDPHFYPYFYLVPRNSAVNAAQLKSMKLVTREGEQAEVQGVLEEELLVSGRKSRALKIVLKNPRHVPGVSDMMEELGTCYEKDIVFWKRYLIDKGLSPMVTASVEAHEQDGDMVIDSICASKEQAGIQLSHMSFDIETYNPHGVPNFKRDPVIMISYTDGSEKRVLAAKKVAKDFVSSFGSEKEMLQAFSDAVQRIDPDVITGYNSSAFDIPYLIERARLLGVDLKLGRYEDLNAKTEHHGLIEAVRIPGRINLDLYNVAKFVSTVGASEYVLKVNNFKLVEVYAAVTGKKKKMVDRANIWEQWDAGGKQVEELAEYSLADSLAVDELYGFFIPIEIEMARVGRTTLGEASISTTSQLAEHMLMCLAHEHKEAIPNKPAPAEIAARLANPYEGAYVKTPEAGIYDNIAVFDFRGLYPSIIIAYNIDPATICTDRTGRTDCTDYYESPLGVRFRKDYTGIMPLLLKMLIDERSSVKKAFKKEPDDKSLAARSTALKILANSFYGYLGYARSRWYSRDCAASITAYGRLLVTKVISEAEKTGFRVIYADTDSQFLLMGNKPDEEAYAFLKGINASLPPNMELELEDFYVRGIFVGKNGTGGGAKKKYALLSRSGRIKRRGFELVRRDWSKVARETQQAVLEAILKEGSKEKAIGIVKDVVAGIRSGSMGMQEFVIHTQLRKGLGNYDIKSPELAAAQKAIRAGVKKSEDLDEAAIGYVITRHGNSISEKAEVEESAQDYDPDYYIEHQVIPATLKILKELGVSEDELTGTGAQKRL